MRGGRVMVAAAWEVWPIDGCVRVVVVAAWEVCSISGGVRLLQLPATAQYRNLFVFFTRLMQLCCQAR